MNTVKLQAAPFLHEVEGQKPKWLWEITQTLGKERQKSAPIHRRIEARRAVHDQLVALLQAGYTVEASIIDQTGGGHAQTYVPRGSDPSNAQITAIRDIPSKGGLLGPRCNDLPRGATKVSPGREQGRARQRTLTATRMWSALARAIKNGTMQADIQGKRVRKVESGSSPRAPWLTVTSSMFRAVAMRAVFESWSGIGSFGRFPIYEELPEGVDESDQIRLEDIAIPTKPVKPAKPTKPTKPDPIQEPPTKPAKPAKPAKPTKPAMVEAPPAKPPRTPKPPRAPAAPLVEPVAVVKPPRQPRKPRATETQVALPPPSTAPEAVAKPTRRTPAASTPTQAPPKPPGGGGGLAGLLREAVNAQFESRAPESNRRYASGHNWRR